jgi:Calcineurin-like phosphoesterase superfamily domain
VRPAATPQYTVAGVGAVGAAGGNGRPANHAGTVMRIVIVSDTHGGHESLGSLSGDVLIHCGDSEMGSDARVGGPESLDEWFGRQSFDTILYVGGNHDFAIQARATTGRPVFRNAFYLEDDWIEIDGMRFYGAPWVPELVGWAYYQSPDAIAERWASIPSGTDVLITHTPPRGILDQNRRGQSCGCSALTARLATLRPRLHCFGHVHASAGSVEQDGTRYVNAASVNSRYQIARGPVTLDL